MEDKKLVEVMNAINTLYNWCEDHPTCDGCDFRKEKIGCVFRGKSPREYDKIK